MTKSFADGCSSHIKDTYFRQSNLLVPDSPGAFVLENVELRGPDYWQVLEANHHCGAGRTGMLCSPVYVLENVRGEFSMAKRLRVRRLLSRTVTRTRGATLPTHQIRDLSPAPLCAFAY